MKHEASTNQMDIATTKRKDSLYSTHSQFRQNEQKGTYNTD